LGNLSSKRREKQFLIKNVYVIDWKFSIENPCVNGSMGRTKDDIGLDIVRKVETHLFPSAKIFPISRKGKKEERKGKENSGEEPKGHS
jgi:hypothetical protein